MMSKMPISHKGRISNPILLSQLTFALVIVAVYLPCVIFIFIGHGDPEQIYYRSSGVFSHEAGHLARIGRPIAALFSNIPLIFVDNIREFRWTRAFSILTIVVVGCAMIRILIARLIISPPIAAVIATGTFCQPGFMLSIVNLTAWPMHILSVVFTVWSYSLLAQTNLLSLVLASDIRNQDIWSVRRNFARYLNMGRLVGAFVLFQSSFFTYPPNSLLLLVFPIALLLFSPMNLAIRGSLFFRDIVFLCIGIFAYVFLSKTLYFPIGHSLGLITPIPSDSPYSFAFDFHLADVGKRLLASVEIAKNLWLLPNFSAYALAGYGAIGVGLLVVTSRRAMAMWFAPGGERGANRALLKSWTYRVFLATLAIVACYVLAMAPIVFSVGGTISYRTVQAATVIVTLVVIYLSRIPCEFLLARLSATQFNLAYAFPVLLFMAWAASYNISSTISLCQNELSYVSRIIHDALARNADALVVVDDRDSFSPHQLEIAYDLHHHAIMPNEMGCFSTYCVTAVGIYAVALQELGVPKDSLFIHVFRWPGVSADLTCDPATDPPDTLRRNELSDIGMPPIPSDQVQWIEHVRTRYKRVSCEIFDLRWRDLERHEDMWSVSSMPRIDQSMWQILLPKHVGK